MRLLFHLLLRALFGNDAPPGPQPRPPLDVEPLELSVALEHVRTGGRYALLSRRAGPGGRLVTLSPVTPMASGARLPAGWSGGEDITNEVLVLLGIPLAQHERLMGESTPVAFEHRLDRPSRYSRRAGAVAAAIFAAGLCAWIGLTRPWDARFLGVFFTTLLFPGGLLAFVSWQADLTGYGSPFYRRDLVLGLFALSIALALALTTQL